MRNQQTFADVKHGAVQVVHSHDQFGSRLYFVGDPLQNVARFDDVLFFFGRRCPREQNVHIDFTEEIFRFVGVNPGRIFLDEGSEGGARFRQFSFLTQLGCSLKLRQR